MDKVEKKIRTWVPVNHLEETIRGKIMRLEVEQVRAHVQTELIQLDSVRDSSGR